MVILDRQGNEVMRLGVAAASFTGAGPFASWSADSRLFAYTHLPTGAPPQGPQGWVEVVDVAARTVITSDALTRAALSMPSWAPAGTRFAAVAAAAPPSRATASIVISGPSGDTTTLTDKPLGGMAMPLWSPDGKWIAYWLPNGVVMAQGGQRRRLEEAMAIVPAGGGEPRLLAEASYPSPQAWSPDGTRIALTCLKPGTPAGASVTGGGICIADPSGGNPATLTDDSGAFGAAFAPEGKLVAYLTDRDGKTGTFTLKVIDAGGRQIRTIATGVPVGGFTWLATQP
ncbi:MAG: TolB family protein [Dehalococcoidia bacterium]